MRASNVLVIDAARIPARPYSPSLAVNAALGLFGGVFLCVAVVFFREHIDRRIQAPGESRGYLNVSELGVIVSEEPSHALLAADSYRAVVTSILLASRHGDSPRIVVVTSPCEGDGKTTVATRLGLAVAETGRKVLLIDGDLRRPRLHQVFHLPNTDGLTDALASDVALDPNASIEHHIQATDVNGLYVLPAGSSAANAGSVLHSRCIAALFERLREEFDMVIVDTPPMLPVPDARVLGRLADGIILVIRSGHTTIEHAFMATQRLTDDGTRVLGTILNGWNPRTGGRYGYGGYYSARES
jgi:receptor protein-tyrosine kinase